MTSERADARLFTDPPPDPSTPEGRVAWIETLLEEGDSRDLRALGARVPEAELAQWLDERGGRRLSGRSRVFWSWVLGRPEPEPHPLTEEIWPL